MTQRTSSTGRTAGGAAPRRRPPADRRIAERRKAIIAARVRRRRRILGWGLAAIALAVGVAYLIRTPLFGLSAVRVTGTEAVAEAEVREAAKVRLGEPYLGLDIAAIQARVAALPRVAAVRVARDYPSSLRIAVTERPPVASVSTGNVYWLVAADGTVLDAAGRRPADLPYVASVPLPDGVRPGSRLPPGNELANALTALGGMAPQLKRQVTGVNARTLDSLEFTLRDGTRVLYGLAVDQPAKDTAVQLIRRTLKREGREAQRIDVRNPASPTVTATPAE
ncbi:MAG TPA: FtsQ-type POTRA domain-containing protein [Actinomycetes bacterium]|jgi:cell division protein FtsQ|nr:FtsQ-type POTRA domain-containing protein [Actinomycetes bacterium]